MCTADSYVVLHPATMNAFKNSHVFRTKLTHVGPGYNWDGWPSSGGYTISGCNQPTRSTQPCIPRGRLIEYQLRLGWRREYHLCWVAGNTVIPYGTWVPIAVRLLANCYTPFTFTCTSCQIMDHQQSLRSFMSFTRFNKPNVNHTI